MRYQNAVLDDKGLQEALKAINPKFGDFCTRVAGEAWGLPHLDQKTKALITIAVDVANQDHNGPGAPFGAHVDMAVKQGATREEIEEVLLLMCVYGGFNKAAGCFGKLNEVLGAAHSPAADTPKEVVMAAPSKGKIAVLTEDHFDPTEYREFNKYFPQQGYEVEYMTRLWGNKTLTFGSNPEGEAPNQQVKESAKVTTDVGAVNPADYKGFILIGAYAMDRLRYPESPRQGQPNKTPAVELMRRVFRTPGVKVGAICHGLWLLCAAPELLHGRKMTCAHNLVCDIENAGGEVAYAENGGTADLWVDGDLVTGKHPDAVAQFMAAFVQEIEKEQASRR